MQIEMNNREVIIQGEGILNLIPQRPPIVMVDSFFGIEENHSYSGLTVTADNIFCGTGEQQEGSEQPEIGKLQEAGIIEHIAQSAAARIGFLYTRQGEKVPLGFIGSVDKLKIYDLPKSRTGIIPPRCSSETESKLAGNRQSECSVSLQSSGGIGQHGHNQTRSSRK
jgi:hypothetical protein